MAEDTPIPPPEPTPPSEAPATKAPKPPRTDIDLDALFPMPQRDPGRGLGHVADKWRLPPGRVNAVLIGLSLAGMILLAPSLFRFALSPAPDSETSLFNYKLLLRLIVFLGCMGFFCAAAGFRFSHWLAQKITDLIFDDGPPTPPKDSGE